MSGDDRRPVIFLAFANDRDDRARYLRNLAEELRRVRERLDQVETGRLCEVVVRTGTTVSELLDVFQDSRYRDRVAVFHFAGHAGGYQLLLESAEGRPEFAHAAGLAEFLGHQRGLQLVFLNGCSTQPQVEGLLQSGVPAVIATSESIDDSMATELSARFYAAVAGGATIANAYAESAAAVKTVKGGRTRDLYRADTADSDRWPWDLYVKEGADVVREWSLPKAAGDPLFGLPPLPEQDLPETPYRHLQWFREEEAELFFGRGREIRAFYEQVTSPSSAPILLFYGQSGVGKSSVLAAGLVPRLASSHQVRYTRRQDLGLAETLATVVGAAGPDAPVAARWHAVESEAGQPLVVILDQVEEVYTRPRPDDPDELERFLQVVSETFTDRSSRPHGKLVLGFRKEWLADLEGRLLEKKLPRSKSYLERLDRDGIVEIVVGPARSERLRRHFNLTVEPGLAELIADDLLEDRDAPVAPTLEVLLTKMWKRATERDANAPAFTTDVYQELRRKGLLLDDFLHEQLSALHDWNGQVVDSGLALDLLAFHTTPLGTAESRTGAEVDAAYPHQSSALPGLLQRNEDLYLLVDHATMTEKEDNRAAATRLAHDTLAPLIRRRFKDSDAPGQRARRILENRSEEWRDGKSGDPLDEADLATVERGEAGMPAWSPDERRLIQASRKLRTERRWKRRFGLVLAAASMMGILSFAAVAEWERGVAREREAEAVSRELSATARGEPALDLALLLGVEAVQMSATFEARDALLGTLLRPVPRLRGTDSGFSYIAFSPEGTTLAAIDHRGTVRLWDVKSRQPIGERLEADTVDDPYLAFSPDGATLAIGSHRGLRLWDVKTRRLIWEPLRGDTDNVFNVAFSPDGRTLAVGSHRGLRLWDVKKREAIGEPLEPGEVISIAFSPDSTTLAAGAKSGAVRLWNVKGRYPLGALVQEGERLVQEGEGSERVWRVQFSPDGTALAGINNGTIRLWDVKTRRLIWEPLGGDTGNVFNLAFSPDGMTLASLTDRELRLWDLKRRRPIGLEPLAGNPVRSQGLAFSPDGMTLAAGTPGLRLWDVKSRKSKGGSLTPHRLRSVAFSPDGTTLAAIDVSGTLRLWDVRRRSPIGELLAADTGDAPSLAFSPDSTTLAVGSRGLRLWDVKTRRLIWEPLRGDTDAILTVAFSPDGTTLAAGGDRSLRLWDAKARRLLSEPLTQDTEAVFTVAFSPNGRTLAAGGDRGVRLWDVKGRQLLGELVQDEEGRTGGAVQSVAFSPDGVTLAVGSTGGLRLWDIKTHSPVREALEKGDYFGGVRAVAFSPDGTTLAAVSDRVRLWDAKTHQLVGALVEEAKGSEDVQSVAFSPNGATLASGGYFGVHLWDVKKRRPIGEFMKGEDGNEEVQSEGVESVAFSPDGTTLASSNGKIFASGAKEGIVRLWSANSATWAGRACALVGHNLTADEWKRYFPRRAYRCTCDSRPPGEGVKVCPGG